MTDPTHNSSPRKPTQAAPKFIEEGLKKDNHVSHFSKLGTLLLKQTNQPNVITLDQFRPFIPMFKIDHERLSLDEGYKAELMRLYNRWRRELGINPYEITIVIYSKEDPREAYVLNRAFTRIKSDALSDGVKSLRESVPGAVPKTSSISREELVLDASLNDLVAANSTPEQKAHFARVRMESALVQKHFVENTMNPEMRAKILGDQESEAPSVSSPTNSVTTTFLDDDD